MIPNLVIDDQGETFAEHEEEEVKNDPKSSRTARKTMTTKKTNQSKMDQLIASLDQTKL